MTPRKPSRWWQRARDAITGRFITLAAALARKHTSVIERLRRRGR
jgi:hypothetical protein